MGVIPLWQEVKISRNDWDLWDDYSFDKKSTPTSLRAGVDRTERLDV